MINRTGSCHWGPKMKRMINSDLSLGTFINKAMIGMLTLLAIPSWGADTVPNVALPQSCFYDAQSAYEQSGNTIKKAACVNVDPKGLVPRAKNYSFGSVCMFDDGLWKRGKLVIKKTDANTYERSFTPSLTCTHGIEVINSQSDTMKVIGPAKIEVYNACLGEDFTKKSASEQKSKASACSHLRDSGDLPDDQQPQFSASDRIISCYRGESGWGTDRDSRPCDSNSSAKMYCDYVDISDKEGDPTFGSWYKGGWRGKWFVQYNAAGKAKPSLCAGGVQISSASSDQKVAIDKLPGTTDVTALTSIKDYKTGESLSTTKDTVSVYGCYLADKKYKICQQKGGCLGSGKCADPANQNTSSDVGKFMRDECFFSQGQWYRVATVNKKNIGTSSVNCEFIDVANMRREDPEDMSAPQENPNVDSKVLDKSTSGEGTVRFGQRDDVDNRALQVGYKGTEEVIGIGADPLTSVCSDATKGCKNFQFKDLGIASQASGGTGGSMTYTALAKEDDVQGRLYVDSGARFNKNVEFEKDLWIKRALKVDNDAYFNQRFFVKAGSNSVSVDGNTAAFSAPVSISQDGALHTPLVVSGGDKSKAAMSVTGSVSINGALQLGADSNLSVSGGAGITKSLSVGENLSVTGFITAANTITSTLNVSSDRRLKMNIEGIPNALEKVLKLKGVYYNFNAKKFPERHLTEAKRVGLIAQEVQKVFPEAVVKDPTGYFAVAYGDLIAPAIESIKELYALLVAQDEEHKNDMEEIRKELQELKLQNQLLKSRIDELEKK